MTIPGVHLAATVVAVLAYSSAHAEDVRKSLTGAEIRRLVIGKEITDGAHWGDYFRKDGILIRDGMGSTQVMGWQIKGNQLCISDKPSGPFNECWEIFLAGEDITLRSHGREFMGPSFLRTYRKK